MTSQQALEPLKTFKIGLKPINNPTSSKPVTFKMTPIMPTRANQNVKDFLALYNTFFCMTWHFSSVSFQIILPMRCGIAVLYYYPTGKLSFLLRL